MLLIPAIDIRHGRCVRLRQGDLDRNVTVYDEDPTRQARRWLDLGARRVHVIDLDGAASGEAVNAELIGRLVALAGPGREVEVGGGIRGMEQIERYLDQGVSQVIIGTAALTDPELVARACDRFPGQIIVALDARGGVVASHGWLRDSGQRASEVARRLEPLGVSAFLYTDIERDGMLTGVNVAATAELARAVKVPVIASGGVRDLDDIRALLAVEADGVGAAILGRSLYEGTLDFAAAQRLVGASEA